MSKLIILKANGERSEEPFPDRYIGGNPERYRLGLIVGGATEGVKVLYNNEPTWMMVNDEGANMIPPLPANKEATRIYWTYSLSGSPDMFDDWWLDDNQPKIHGDVAILEGVPIE